MKLKSLLGLSAVALLALTGCAKEVTYDEALKQVNSYTQEGRKAKIHKVVKVSKLEGIFEKLSSVYKNEDKNYEEAVCPITAAQFAAYPSDIYKYYLDGTKLEIKADLTGDALRTYIETQLGMQVPNAEINGKAYEYTKTNENGLPLLQESKLDFSIKMSGGGITVEGAMCAEIKITYSLTNEKCASCN